MPNGPSRPSADRAWRLNEHGSEHGMVLVHRAARHRCGQIISSACVGSIPILFGLSLGRTLDPVHIPRTIDRDEQQRAFVRLGPGLMNRLAGHVVERARPQFMALPLLML